MPPRSGPFGTRRIFCAPRFEQCLLGLGTNSAGRGSCCERALQIPTWLHTRNPKAGIRGETREQPPPWEGMDALPLFSAANFSGGVKDEPPVANRLLT